MIGRIGDVVRRINEFRFNRSRGATTNPLSGTVTRMDGSSATVTMDDGTDRVVEVSEMIQVEVGMRVTIVDFGDGKPIYSWGS